MSRARSKSAAKDEAKRLRQQKKPALPVPPPSADPAPLPTDLLTGPRLFGQALARSDAKWWHYWPAVVVPAVLSGIAYALLVAPAARLAAELSKTAAPPLISHITNAFGSFFLTVLTFALMWGLGRLAAGRGTTTRGTRVAEVFSASFALLVPLYLLVILLTLLTPAAAWNPPAESLQQAGTDPRLIERASLAMVAQTHAAFALGLTTLLGTVVQCLLALFALRETVGHRGRATLAALLPLVPALFVGLIAIAPLLLAR